MIEFPDFDFEGFYMLAKRINDFLNGPEFQNWSQIITESLQCKKQVSFLPKTIVFTYNLKIRVFEDCMADLLTVQLGNIIQNSTSQLPNFSQSEFDDMHNEVDKCELFSYVSDNNIKL